jgi:hypothetical protein
MSILLSANLVDKPGYIRQRTEDGTKTYQGIQKNYSVASGHSPLSLVYSSFFQFLFS